MTATGKIATAGGKIRPNFGHTGGRSDTLGPIVDAEVLTGIWDKAHGLHASCYEAARYSPEAFKDDPIVQELRATIDSGGCPDRLIVRMNGTIEVPRKKGAPVDPIIQYLRDTYPAGSKDAYEDTQQPRLEVLSGNTRLWLTLEVNRVRRENGLKPYKVPIDLRPNCPDGTARDIFLKSNAHRRGNSFSQNLKIFRSLVADGIDKVDELALQLGVPASMVNTFVVCGSCEDAVVEAFAAGQIRERRLGEIAKLPRSKQVAALAEKKTATPKSTGQISPYRLKRAADVLEIRVSEAKPNDVIPSYSARDMVQLLRRIAGDDQALKGNRFEDHFEELFGK